MHPNHPDGRRRSASQNRIEPQDLGVDDEPLYLGYAHDADSEDDDVTQMVRDDELLLGSAPETSPGPAQFAHEESAPRDWSPRTPIIGHDVPVAESRHRTNVRADSFSQRTSARAQATPQSESPRSYQAREPLRRGDVFLGKYRISRVQSSGPITSLDALHIEMAYGVQILTFSAKERRLESARAHFLKTAQVLSRVQSKHNCRLLDAGRLDSGENYMIVRIAPGISLAQRVHERGPLPVTTAVDLILQISEGIAEVHAHGLMHGSLTPSNVRLLSGMDGRELAMIAGYGAPAMAGQVSNLAVASPGHRRKLLRGALAYLSPEQIRHPQELDSRSDIWALGAMLHEALTGEPTYQQESESGLFASIAADSPVPVTASRDDVPRELESVVLRCLAKDPRGRFPDIADLARALQPFGFPEAAECVERIAHIVARGVPQRSERRPQRALVRVRPSPARESSRSAGATVATSLQEGRHRLQLRSVTGVAIVVGVLAGVGGGLGATHLVLRSKAMQNTPTTGVASHDTGRSISARVFAATPAALVTEGKDLDIPTIEAAALPNVSNAETQSSAGLAPVAPTTPQISPARHLPVQPSVAEVSPKPKSEASTRPPLRAHAKSAGSPVERGLARDSVQPMPDERASTASLEAAHLFEDIK